MAARVRETLEAMPRVAVTAEEEAEEEECAICAEDWEAGEMLVQLPCRHRFHHDCIKSWLVRKCTCPLCMQEVALVPAPAASPTVLTRAGAGEPYRSPAAGAPGGQAADLELGVPGLRSHQRPSPTPLSAAPVGEVGVALGGNLRRMPPASTEWLSRGDSDLGLRLARAGAHAQRGGPRGWSADEGSSAAGSARGRASPRTRDEAGPDSVDVPRVGRPPAQPSLVPWPSCGGDGRVAFRAQGPRSGADQDDTQPAWMQQSAATRLGRSTGDVPSPPGSSQVAHPDSARQADAGSQAMSAASGAAGSSALPLACARDSAPAGGGAPRGSGRADSARGTSISVAPSSSALAPTLLAGGTPDGTPAAASPRMAPAAGSGTTRRFYSLNGLRQSISSSFKSVRRASGLSREASSRCAPQGGRGDSAASVGRRHSAPASPVARRRRFAAGFAVGSTDTGAS